MQKKEFYKHNLPHFQQPGQAYFVTWSLKGAVPNKALKRYTDKLEILKSQMNAAVSEPPTRKDADRNQHHPEFKTSFTETEKLRKEFYTLRKKYIKAYDDLQDAERNPKIDLLKPENLSVMIHTLMFWEGKTIQNQAFCIMPNHVHWVFEVFEKDENGNPVYLQDILYSVKRFSASHINKLENRQGPLWQKESFDTTIRDEKHLYYAIEYTLNNPVNARFVSDWRHWPGSWSAE